MCNNLTINDNVLYNHLHQFVKFVSKNYSELDKSSKLIDFRWKYETMDLPEDDPYPFAVFEHDGEYFNYAMIVGEIIKSTLKNKFYLKLVKHINTNFKQEFHGEFEVTFFLRKYFNINQAINFNEKLFNKLYKSFENRLFKKQTTVKAYSIIANISMNSNEIVLDDKTKLVKLTKEIHDIIYNESAEKSYLEELLTRKGGIVLTQVSKTNAGERTPNFSLEKRNEIINFLSLYKAGDFATLNTIIIPKNHFQKETTIGDNNKIPLENNKLKYTLSTEVAELIEFYNLYMSSYPEFSNFIKLAISRFNQTRFRKSIEDKLVDIIIAFESLFLNNNPELSFRLGYSVAHFICDSPKEKRKIFDNTKKAYNYRSRIVHGSSGVKDFEKIIDLINELKVYFRKSLKIILEKKYYRLPKDKFVKQIENINLGIF